VPVEIGSEFTKELINVVLRGTELYNRALQYGIAPEQARLFLPAYGLYVRWRWTASLQSVLTFLEQRLGHDAQVEIQEYAKEIGVIVRQEFPEVYKAFQLGV
jgi:thymidylate synthase (FAD)